MFHTKLNPFIKKEITLEVWGPVAGLAHNLNWEPDAEQVFSTVIYQFPLHNQFYLEMKKGNRNFIKNK